MPNTFEVSFHVKRHTDFELLRIIKAQEQGFAEPVTAYLCRVAISSHTGIGIVFGHKREDQYGRFGDGHLLRTSDVIKAEREGRFWVLTTVGSRYVIATFQRGNGRSSLREFLRHSRERHLLPPHVLQ